MINGSAKLVYLNGKTELVRYKKSAISSGADGTIYASVGNKLALKIYHDPSKDKQRQDKLWQMLSNAPKSDGFCWPIAVLSDNHGVFIGYAMPLLDLSHYQTLEMLLNKRLRTSLGITESYQFRVTVAINLATKVAELHKLGHHIIDMKPVNISFDQFTGDIVILDCDGFSIKGKGKQFRGHQYTAGYIAPEAFRAHLSPEKLGLKQDLFALATILFQLLNNGLHPFQGVPKPGKQLPTDNQAKITAGLYAYATKSHPRIKPSPWSIHRDFPNALQKAFTKSLTTIYRKDAYAWKNLLEVQKTKLKICSKDSNHYFWRTNCPHCYLSNTRVNVKPKPVVKPTPVKKRVFRRKAVKTPPVQQVPSTKQASPAQHVQFVKKQNKQPSRFSTLWVILGLFVFGYIIVLQNNHSKNNPVVAKKVVKKQIEVPAKKIEQPVVKVSQTNAAMSFSGNVLFRSKAQQYDRESTILAEIPFHQLTRFESTLNYPLLKHTPLSSSFLSTSPVFSLNEIDFTLGGKNIGHLDSSSTRGYKLDDWQYDSFNEIAYVYNCRYGPNICTDVTQLGKDKNVNFKFNDFIAEADTIMNVRKLGTSKNSYRPWRFRVTKDSHKLVMASNSTIVVYDVNDQNKPLIKQDLPKSWGDFILTRLLSLDNGERLIMSLGKSEPYGVNYEGFVVELTLDNGEYLVSTDFSHLPQANIMSGIDVATNDAGDILAIGEYIEPERNDNTYQALGRSIEVELAYAIIRFWNKTDQGWQLLKSSEGIDLQVLYDKSSFAKEMVTVPKDISNSSDLIILRSGPKLISYSSLNRGFMFNQSGDRLLTGLDGVQRDGITYATAGLYELNVDKPNLYRKTILKNEYNSRLDPNEISQIYISASLSNDGRQASLGWFQYYSNYGNTKFRQSYEIGLFDL
jgi:hypothetical protein